MQSADGTDRRDIVEGEQRRKRCVRSQQPLRRKVAGLVAGSIALQLRHQLGIHLDAGATCGVTDRLPAWLRV